MNSAHFLPPTTKLLSLVGEIPTKLRAVFLQKNHPSRDRQGTLVGAHYARFWFCSKEVEALKELRVFIADDSEAIKQQLRRALSIIAGFKLVGVAGGNSEAAELIRAVKPDVVILDIPMPHKEGINVLREIRKEVHPAQIIIFTAEPSVVLQEVCLEAGADFFLRKSQTQELIDICSEQLAHI
jgi:CheY-like chemotaxis protein